MSEAMKRASVNWGAVDGQIKVCGLHCYVTLDRKAGVFRCWPIDSAFHLCSIPVSLYSELLSLLMSYKGIDTLDGEIYLHGATLHEIQEMLYDPEHPRRDELQFWLYSVVDTNLTWEKRRDLTNTVDDSLYSHIVRVRSVPLANEEECRDMWAKAVRQDYQGLRLINWQEGEPVALLTR